MKFFKCHSQKMKNDKIICLQDKFTDIGPDVFSGFSAEYIILADTTKFVRGYAFSGLGKCNIYLPKSIEEIEPLAFENIDANTVFFCVKGSYAERVCTEHGLIINTDVGEIFTLAEEQKKIAEQQKQLEEEQKRKEEEQRRQAQEQKRREEEQRRLEEEKKLREEEQRRLEEEKRLQEEQKLAEEQAQKEALEKARAEAEAQRPVTIHIFHVIKGESSKTVKFSELPDSGKNHVENNEIFIHCKYADYKESNTFINKEEYMSLVQAANSSKQEEKAPAAAAEPTQNKASNQCPFCSETLIESDVFCPYCGKKVKNIKICSNCNEPNDINDNFCSSCGTRL